MCVLIFSATFVSNVSHSKKKWKKYDKKNIYWSSLYLLLLSEFSEQILEKYSNFKFCGNLSSEIRNVTCGQRNGRTSHDETNSSIFETWTNAHKKTSSVRNKDYFMKKIGRMEVYRHAFIVKFTLSVMWFIIQLLQFEPTNAHYFIKIRVIIEITKSCIIWTLISHHQRACNCTKQLLKISYNCVHFDDGLLWSKSRRIWCFILLL